MNSSQKLHLCLSHKDILHKIVSKPKDENSTSEIDIEVDT